MAVTLAGALSGVLLPLLGAPPPSVAAVEAAGSPISARSAPGSALAALDGWARSTRVDDAPRLCRGLLPRQRHLQVAQERPGWDAWPSWRGTLVYPSARQAAQVLEFVPRAGSGCSADAAGQPGSYEIDARRTRVAGRAAGMVSVRPYDNLGSVNYLAVREGRQLWFGATRSEIETMPTFARARLLRGLYLLDRHPRVPYSRARAAWVRSTTLPTATAYRAQERAARVLDRAPDGRFERRARQLRQLAALPATSLTRAEQARARRLIGQLDQFFWTAGRRGS